LVKNTVFTDILRLSAQFAVFNIKKAKISLIQHDFMPLLYTKNALLQTYLASNPTCLCKQSEITHTFTTPNLQENTLLPHNSFVTQHAELP